MLAGPPEAALTTGMPAEGEGMGVGDSAEKAVGRGGDKNNNGGDGDGLQHCQHHPHGGERRPHYGGQHGRHLAFPRLQDSHEVNFRPFGLFGFKIKEEREDKKAGQVLNISGS